MIKINIEEKVRLKYASSNKIAIFRKILLIAYLCLAFLIIKVHQFSQNHVKEDSIYLNILVTIQV
jgi:hypothetical protein